MPTGRIRIQVDRDAAVLLDALDELGNARRRIDARTLRQHRRGNEMIGKEPVDAVAQLVADRSPRARDLEIADVMRHEAGARTEYRDVQPALTHLSQLVALDRFAQLVVADTQLGRT